MTATVNFEEIGKILRTKASRVDNLVEKIKNAKMQPEIRSAALDRYAEIKKSDAFGILNGILNDFNEPEELRVHCQHWLKDPKMIPKPMAKPTKGVAARTPVGPVQTKGGVVHTTGKVIRHKTATKPAEPSERLRWLNSL